MVVQLAKVLIALPKGFRKSLKKSSLKLSETFFVRNHVSIFSLSMTSEIKIFMLRFAEKILVDYLHANKSGKKNLWNCSRSFFSFISSSWKSLWKYYSYLRMFTWTSIWLLSSSATMLDILCLFNRSQMNFNKFSTSRCFLFAAQFSFWKWWDHKWYEHGMAWDSSSLSQGKLSFASLYLLFPKECFVCIHLNINIKIFRIYLDIRGWKNKRA